MANVKIVTTPVREGTECEIQVTGTEPVAVTIAVGGVVICNKTVQPPVTLAVKLPADSAGKTIRASVPGDFDSAFILAP